MPWPNTGHFLDEATERPRSHGLGLYDIHAVYGPPTAEGPIRHSSQRAVSDAMPELQRLDADRLAAVARELREGGLTRVAAAFDSQVAAMRQGEGVTLRGLERLLRDESLYVFTTERPQAAAEARGRFAYFSRFVDGDGRLCYQCTGAASLFQEVLASYFAEDFRFRSTTRVGYVAEGGALRGSGRHAQTVLHYLDRVIAVYDATPAAAPLAGAMPLPESLDATARALAISKARRVTQELDGLRRARRALVTAGVIAGPERLRSSRLVAETTMLGRVADEVARGELTVAQASQDVRARIPGLDLPTESHDIFMEAVSARARILRTEMASMDEARHATRTRAPVAAALLDDPSLRGAMDQVLAT